MNRIVCPEKPCARCKKGVRVRMSYCRLCWQKLDREVYDRNYRNESKTRVFLTKM